MIKAIGIAARRAIERELGSQRAPRAVGPGAPPLAGRRAAARPARDRIARPGEHRTALRRRNKAPGNRGSGFALPNYQRKDMGMAAIWGQKLEFWPPPSNGTHDGSPPGAGATAPTPTATADQPLRVLLVASGQNQHLTAKELLWPAGPAAGSSSTGASAMTMGWSPSRSIGTTSTWSTGVSAPTAVSSSCARRSAGGPRRPSSCSPARAGATPGSTLPSSASASSGQWTARIARASNAPSARRSATIARSPSWPAARSATHLPFAPPTTASGTGTWWPTPCISRPGGMRSSGARHPEADRGHETWFELVHPADLARLRAAVDAHLEGRSPALRAEHRMRHADGSWRWVLTRGLATRGADGRPTRMAGSMSDVTDRRLAQLRLQHDALHDGLTGLPNRTLFLDRVHQTLQRVTRDPRAACAVLFMDSTASSSSTTVSATPSATSCWWPWRRGWPRRVRPGDTVARLGGDEFAVLLQEIDDADEAVIVAERILTALRAVVHHRRPRPVLQRQHRDLAQCAGNANPRRRRAAAPTPTSRCTHAKRRGRGRAARCSTRRMRRSVVDRLARENELRQVVECVAAADPLPADRRAWPPGDRRDGGAGPLARGLGARVRRRSSSRSPRTPA